MKILPSVGCLPGLPAILQLNEEHGDGNMLKGYTHQQLADMLGTYRETTTQTLNDFKQQGFISLGVSPLRYWTTRDYLTSPMIIDCR